MRDEVRDWDAATRAYLTAQTAAGRSPGTRRLHQHYLRRLAEQQPDPWSVTTDDLRRFLAVDSWAPETRKSARAAVRGFYRWAHGTGRIDEDPGVLLDPVRIPPAAPRPAPETVVARGLRADEERVRLMVRLAAYAGLRAAEIARVRVDDIEGDLLRVRGKGGRTRLVPLADDLVDTIRGCPGPWLFPNGRGSHLTPGHVSRLVSRALPPGWTAHTLRHRLATRAYAGTRDLLAVSELLGHSRPETTQRYVQLPDDALRAAVRAAA